MAKAIKKDGGVKSTTSLVRVKPSKPKKIGVMPSSNYSESKRKISVDISGGNSLVGNRNKKLTVEGDINVPIVNKKKYNLSLTGSGGVELGKNKSGSISPGIKANISLGGNKKKTIKKPF